MSIYISIIFAVFFIIRVLFLWKSKKNEAAIKRAGGEEYGKRVSAFMALAHTLYYATCLIEGIVRKSTFSFVSLIGTIVLIASMLMLWKVTQLLGDIWTVKLMVAKNHSYVKHWLFNTIKHPNYFLNIIPELIGLALLMHAWFTLAIGLPIYAVILALRIQEENRWIATFSKK